MGVMSRRVVPVCGNLCCFCPSLRARSRQPVKRYKKLLAEIFPRNQDAEPNDKKIGKLCDYTSKNPLRIPKIAEYLEQRCYKDLRNENFGSVKVVLCIYRKLLSSCKEHLLLFASSMLGIIHTVLEETRQDELQILACATLVDFMNSQADSTYLFNLEGLIPKLCQVASETGDSDQALCLRSTGMQALACMVLFMGDHSHISMDFHKIISVMLDNFTFRQPKEEMLCLQSDLLHTQSDLKVDDKSSLPGMSNQATLLPVVLAKADVEPPMDAIKNPSYWSRVCLRNIARLAKEAATARRVLEPLFQSFDTKNHWAIGEGLGCSVLMYLQSLLDESESSSDLLFSILVKHLDHKNVAGKSLLQIDIVKVTTVLARNAKRRASVTILGAISELIKQLRRCVQRLAEGSTTEGVIDKKRADLQSSLEDCILDLSSMVGDVGPILDTMSVGLESLPVTAIVARSAIFAVYRIACMISSIPNASYDKKAFSDALFHQLILAMAHPDSETRVGAHCILSTVLMPKPVESLPSDMDVQKYCFKFAFHNERTEIYSLRLTSHQVSILLSSIWVQATSSENTPANYEAMAHTYDIAFLFARSKTDNHAALARCFQLALSLRSASLEVEGCLQPSRKRSLFTLASYMIIASAKAENLSELITHVKASLTDETIDPYFELINDTRLGAVCTRTNISYGSEEDEAAAVKSLSAIVSDDQQLKEMILPHLLAKSGSLTEDELSTLKEQFLQAFSPDGAYPLGVPSFMETPRPCPPLGNVDLHNLDQVTPPDSITDDDDDSKSLLSPNPVDVLNVNQLMESVRETAQQVSNFPLSSAPVTYDQMKSQCEALSSEKHHKLSMLQSFKNQEDAKEESVSPGSKMKKEFSEEEDLKLVNIEKGLAIHGQYALRLPPSSPYDKFLKAAGC